MKKLFSLESLKKFLKKKKKLRKKILFYAMAYST